MSSGTEKAGAPGEGRVVEEVPIVQGQRNADALVDKIETEFKTMSPGGDSKTILNQVTDSIKRGGQARNIIIDARGSGLTEPEAARGLDRVGGVQAGKLDSVRIIGDGFDVTRKY